MPDNVPITPAMLELISKLTGSPAMKSMASLQAIIAENGFDPKLIEALVPALMRFALDSQSAGKLPQAAEFVAQVMLSAANFGPEMTSILETFVNKGQS